MEKVLIFLNKTCVKRFAGTPNICCARTSKLPFFFLILLCHFHNCFFVASIQYSNLFVGTQIALEGKLI